MRTTATTTPRYWASSIARKLVAAGYAARSASCYAFDWLHFRAWAQAHGRSTLPAAMSTVSLYVVAEHERGLARGSLINRLKSISTIHRVAHAPDPTRVTDFRRFMRGFKRSTSGRRPPLVNATPELVRTLVVSIPLDLRGTRDRAIILSAWAAVLATRDIVSLRIDQLRFDDGLRLRLRNRSITVGPGLSSETCPLAALRAWLRLSGIREGFVFRPCRYGVRTRPLNRVSLSNILRARSRAAGLPSLTPEALRRGAILMLVQRGVPAADIAAFVGLGQQHIDALVTRELVWRHHRAGVGRHMHRRRAR